MVADEPEEHTHSKNDIIAKLLRKNAELRRKSDEDKLFRKYEIERMNGVYEECAKQQDARNFEQRGQVLFSLIFLEIYLTDLTSPN